MKQDLETLLIATVHDLFDVTLEVELTRPDEQFGDYATNIALQLSHKLKKNPREIAEMIAHTLQKTATDKFESIEVAGAGFLNIRLSDTVLIETMTVRPQLNLAGQVVIAEYSDPNPFKVLHAGHLYTTLVGDAIARLFEAAGATVFRLNFGGDVGLHVGKTIWAIIQELGGEFPEKLNTIADDQHLEWLSAKYVAGNNAYEDNEVSKAAIIECNKRVYALYDTNDHESAYAQIYWTCRQWSYDGFDRLYERLAVSPFDKYYPESLTAPEGMKLVEQGLASGVFARSEGAIVFLGEKQGLHTRVFVNSAGLPTYETKDLGLSALKWQDYHFDKSIVVTASEQTEYMKVVFAALTNFYPDAANHSEHLTHGIIKLAGGVKMSSRKGNILRADDVLDAAETANREATGSNDFGTVLAAVKYAFLKQRIGADIIYDPSESVSILGNSGPYLQYAHARARSIMRKAATQLSQTMGTTVTKQTLDPNERTLVRKISEYPEIVDKAVAERMPHHICGYLYELAQAFNRFYEKSRVIGDSREQLRLGFVTQYATTLKEGLTLLGIDSPDKM